MSTVNLEGSAAPDWEVGRPSPSLYNGRRWTALAEGSDEHWKQMCSFSPVPKRLIVVRRDGARGRVSCLWWEQEPESGDVLAGYTPRDSHKGGAGVCAGWRPCKKAAKIFIRCMRFFWRSVSRVSPGTFRVHENIFKILRKDFYGLQKVCRVPRSGFLEKA